MEYRCTITPERHVLVNGQRVRGVGYYLAQGGLATDYSQVPQAVLDKAAERGRYVERAAQMYCDGVLDVAAVHPECRPYVDAWIAHCYPDTGDPPFRAERWQRVVYHPEHNYCGIVDVDGDVGSPVTLDIKTTAKPYDTHRLQVAAYTMPGLLEDDGAGRLVPRAHRGPYVVYLTKRGTVEVVEVTDADRDAWRACLTLARWKRAA